METPNREGGVEKGLVEAGGYQILNPVTQDSSGSESSYDYPVDTDPVTFHHLQQVTPSEIEAAALAMAAGEACEVPTDSALLELRDNVGFANTDSFSSSEGDSSDPGEGRRHSIVRQVPSQASNISPMDRGHGSDDKLYITGTLDNCPSVFFKTATVPVSNEEFEDEGIYQGLVMTDRQKLNLGILPESIYMTNNLIRKGALIESISLSPTIPAVAVEVPEVPLHPLSPSIFKDPVPSTIPKNPPPSTPSRISSSRIQPNSRGTSVRSVSPRYRDMILRPPPLPPLGSGANRAEKKAFAVVENLVKSEAAYLTSLNIAIQVYMNPLMEKLEGPVPVPILSLEEIETVFGPVNRIIKFQEIFYSAITSRTLDWTPLQKIGDVLSSLSTKDVVQNYSRYVNNFTSAMATLEKAINKKPKFVQFLKQKYAHSRTSLSLQGLLLKPIQRFPQYIMFLQDLIKFTCSSHPDRVTLQMALARYEGIANFLNESKRQQEQKAVVQNLTNKISHLPFKLTDGKRWLYRQDIVSRLITSNGKVVGKDRCLLLFNNMILCAAMKRRKKKGLGRDRTAELESSTGSRDFQSVSNYLYTCKWYCPLEELEVCPPDYVDDVWDQAMPNSIDLEYIELKERYKRLEQDSNQFSSIVTIAASLHDEYKGLTCQELSNHVRILQRKIAEVKVAIKSRQAGRLDMTLPSRENDRRVHHTYVFQSERAKLDWTNNLRYAKLKLNRPVLGSWVIAEDISQGDIFEVSYKLPLFVDNYTLNMIDNELLSVQCAAKVGQTYVWLASGDNRLAQISIVECVTPSPLILECFKVDSKRIIDIIYVPPSSLCFNVPDSTPTIKRNSRSSGTGLLSTQIPSYLATVWLGSQCGRVIIYHADTAGDGPKQCLATIKLRDAVTSLQYYKDQVFVSTAEGDIVIFKRTNVSGFNLSNKSSVHICPESSMAIRCTCIVSNKMWVGMGASCYFFNMQTHKVEGNIEMDSKPGVSVSKMVNQGEGVWVSYKGNSSLELFHTISKSSLQNIDIKATLSTIINRHKLETRLVLLRHIHVTSIMTSNGYLWIGTNVGAVLIYHIPHLDSVPIVSGKPYLAMDGHVGAVRVLLCLETMATYESSRLGKFLADEQYRTMREEELKEEIEESHDQEEEQAGTLRKRSMSDPVYRTAGADDDSDTLRRSGPKDTPTSSDTAREGILERSSTPQLEDPSTLILEGSCFVTGEEVEPDGKEAGLNGEEAGLNGEEAGLNGEEAGLNGEEAGLNGEEAGLNGEEAGLNGEEVGLDEEKEGLIPDPDEYYSYNELESKRKFGEGIHAAAASREERGHGTFFKTDLAAPGDIDISMQDSGDYTIPYVDQRPDSGGILYGNITAGGQQEEEDPYSNPSELDSVGFGGRGMAGEENPYNNPHELGFRGRGVAGEENPYSDPRELGFGGNGVAGEENPYSNPRELGFRERGVESNLDSGGRGVAGKENPYSNPRELGFRERGVESNLDSGGRGVAGEENPYSNPRELGFRGRGNLRGVAGEESPYSNPRELEGKGSYDFPTALVHTGTSEVHPYEDPATLIKDPSMAGPLTNFSSAKVLSNSLRILGRPPQKEGAIFVLTAGRGLVNLRPDNKATQFNQNHKDAEGCMIAYEIEM